MIRRDYYESRTTCYDRKKHVDNLNTILYANANLEIDDKTAKCLLKKQQEKFLALESLLRANIFERVGYQFIYDNRIGLREGYKVVKLPDRDVPVFNLRFDGS